VLVPSGPWDTLQIADGVTAWRHWHQQLAQKHLLVRYDARGTGLSDEATACADLEQRVEDLTCVIESLGLRQVALLAAQTAGPVAISFAVRHPERVSHLVLWCTYARGGDYFRSTHSLALHAMAEKDWSVFVDSMCRAELGWSAGEAAQQLAPLFRQHVAPSGLAAHDALSRAIDVTALLSRLQTPTLVVHKRQVSHPLEQVARSLASGIPKARLALLDGDSVAPFVGDVAAALALLETFLAEEVPASRPATPADILVEVPSSRELEVLALLAAGQSNEEIARTLFLTVGTVKTHLNAIYRKLDVHSRTQAVARARALNLIAR
jgi:DNA-binding CsgD family transcriptional regulator/pimeloyl-ACP methyl ester carboxylesterase